jgi:hypothetical protein
MMNQPLKKPKISLKREISGVKSYYVFHSFFGVRECRSNAVMSEALEIRFNMLPAIHFSHATRDGSLFVI